MDGQIRERVRVHPEVIRRSTFAVKDVDPAHAAKVVLRPLSVPFVERQQILAAEDREGRFRHLCHQRVAGRAERAIAGRQLINRMIEPELHSAAVARSPIGAHECAVISR